MIETLREESFLILKPDAIKKGYAGFIIHILNFTGKLNIDDIVVFTFNSSLCKTFYNHHINSDFFPSLEDFMTSGPSWALFVSGENAINVCRNLIGHTDPKKAEKCTIRAMFGNFNNISENVIHASSSLEDVKKESKMIREFISICERC